MFFWACIQMDYNK